MKPSRSLSSAYPPALLLVFALMTLLACAHSGAALGSEERLQAQRVAFKNALPKAEAGDWNSVRPYLDLLQDYPLRPDLSAAWLRSSLGPETDAEVRRFLDQHPDLSFTRDLRYQWAQSLARRRALKLPDDVARYLLDRTPRHPGDLVDTIARLDKASLAEKRRLTIPFVRDSLQLG